QFLRHAACINHIDRIALGAVQSLVTCDAGHPDNDVIVAISRCDPWRASAALTYGPSAHDRGWTRRGNLPGGDRARVVMKTKICSLAGMVSDSGGPSVNSSHVRRGHR